VSVKETMIERRASVSPIFVRLPGVESTRKVARFRGGRESSRAIFSRVMGYQNRLPSLWRRELLSEHLGSAR
jgi:hypothetical protein